MVVVLGLIWTNIYEDRPKGSVSHHCAYRYAKSLKEESIGQVSVCHEHLSSSDTVDECMRIVSENIKKRTKMLKQWHEHKYFCEISRLYPKWYL